MSHHSFLALAATLTLLAGCSPFTGNVTQNSGASSSPGHLRGETISYLGGSISTWAVTDDDGTIEQVGVTVPMSVIEASRMELREGEDPMVHDPADSARIGFPVDVSVDTFIDHFDLDYNVSGHPPLPYQIPHFDLHYYGITEGEQLSIDCTDTQVVETEDLPPNYILSKPGQPPEGECVPAMGHHAVDILSTELREENPETFTKTMVLGYYEGVPTFVEPMISRDQLLKKETFTLTIPVPPAGLDDGILFPTVFTATYNEDTDAYDFVLSEFRLIEDEDPDAETGTGSDAISS